MDTLHLLVQALLEESLKVRRGQGRLARGCKDLHLWGYGRCGVERSNDVHFRPFRKISNRKSFEESRLLNGVRNWWLVDLLGMRIEPL